MKFSIECGADTKIKIPKIITITQGTRDWIFYPNSAGFLTRIKIIEKISDSSKFYSEFIKKTPSTQSHEIRINLDLQVYDSLINELQQLEGTLSLTGMKRLHWDEPRWEIIPETEAEKKQAKILGLEIKKAYPEKEFQYDEAGLKVQIETMSKYVDLMVLFAFFREGMNDFTRFRYINAFYSFYFILEDLYGGGKTKNEQIEENFKTSSELSKFILEGLKSIDNSEKHKKNLEAHLNERNLKYTAEDVAILLVRARGVLHHFSRKNKLKQGTPFNQKDFETLAFLCLGLALKGILYRIVEINTTSENKAAT